jgi:hypothetical protein
VREGRINGKPMSVKQVNTHVRPLVNQALLAAHKSDKIPYRAVLQPIAKLKPRARPSRNDHAAANGQATKPAAIATSTTPAIAEASATIEWTTYEAPGHWEKVFVDMSWKTIRRRVAAGKLRAEQLHKQAWRFAVSDLPTGPRKPR